MEGKHILISILAALVAYSVSAAVMIPIYLSAGDFLRDVVTAALINQGAPQEAIDEAVKAVQPIANILPYLIPVSIILNSALIGALFGMLYSYLISRTGRKTVAALLTGAAYAALNGLGLALIYTEGVLDVMSKYVPPYALVTPAIAYLAALTLFSTKGPWEKLADATPSKY